MKRKLLFVLLSALVSVGSLFALSQAEATTGSRPIATVPLDSGLMRIVNGVEQPNASLISPADFAADAGIVFVSNPSVVAAGYVPTRLADGGAAWAQVSVPDAGVVTTLPYGDVACTVVDAGSVFCSVIKEQGFGLSSATPIAGQIQVWTGSVWQNVTVTGDISLSDAGRMTVNGFTGAVFSDSGAPTAIGQVLSVGPGLTQLQWATPASGSFSAGGDLTGSSVSQRVASLSLDASIPVTTGETFLSGANLKFANGGTTPNTVSNADIIVPYAGGNVPIITSTYSTAGEVDILTNNASAGYAYFGGASTGGVNNSELNGYVSSGLQVAGTQYLNATASQVTASKPIVGDGISSPYALNGVTNLGTICTSGTSPTLTAPQYANRIIVASGVGSASIVLPATVGYDKLIVNNCSGTLTVSGPSGTSTVVAANKKAYFGTVDGTNVVRFSPDT